MKRIFLIMLTICLVMLVGCGETSSSKEIDYLNLTLENLKNIDWNMTLDEFKESIGDVEFEEEKEIIRESEYESIAVKINNFSFGGFDNELIRSYEFFESNFKDGFLSEVVVIIYPIEGKSEDIINVCELTFGKTKEERQNNLFWEYGNTNIQLNTQGVFTFVVTQK